MGREGEMRVKCKSEDLGILVERESFIVEVDFGVSVVFVSVRGE